LAFIDKSIRTTFTNKLENKPKSQACQLAVIGARTFFPIPNTPNVYRYVESKWHLHIALVGRRCCAAGMADQQVSPAHPGCSPPPQTQGAAPDSTRQQSCFAGRGLFQSSAI
jgi:hypothetical protein